jgi:hypothetical protein
MDEHALVALTLRVTVRNADYGSFPSDALTIITVEDNPVDVSLVRWVRTAHFEKPNYLNEFMQPGDLIKDLAFGNPPTFTQNN